MKEKLKMLNKIKKTPKITKKLPKETVLRMIAIGGFAITHIAVVLAIVLSFRYRAIYPSLFNSVVVAVLSLMAIIDIVFFIGFKHKDLALKIISSFLVVAMFLAGTVGTYFVAKANNIVSNIVDTDNSYEKYSGIFVSYDENNTFTDISQLAGKKLGLLKETTNGISYIASNILDEQKIDCGTVYYTTNNELMIALIDGDVDAIAITSAYRSIIETDENSSFTDFLDHFVDFNPFEQEIKVDSKKKTKNITTEPFNVLLIGYSRTDIGSPVGLADSIILATINPLTYTVSMMSIARDSFVPIACYGGEYDKINSGRSTSRACFIETVEDFIGMDIDYYMELDYLGLVAIVNTIGGIYINNPVTFTLDGITVEEGYGLVDGQQALQFCRERHHMPNGDFDRQQHQKEVIIEIAKTFINSGDVALALKAMEEASDWMSTDLSLSQLTSMFNLLLNTKNNTSLKTFDLVDFETLRMTGYGGIMYYSYSMRLPLWVYLIYQGSYDESMQHVNDVMGNYKSFAQDNAFEFSLFNEYERAKLYSETYSGGYMFTPDPMPAYWVTLSGMSESQAKSWAAANGVSLNISYIEPSDASYNPESAGLVCGQSVRYGSLVSDYKSGTIYVMAESGSYLPNFNGWTYKDAVNWCNENSRRYKLRPFFVGNDEADKNGMVYQLELDDDQTTVKIRYYAVCKNGTAVDGDCNCNSGYKFDNEKGCVVEEDTVYTITLDANGGVFTSIEGSPSKTTVKSNSNGFVKPERNGYTFDGWYDGNDKYSSPSQVESDITLTAKWKKNEPEPCKHEDCTDATCEAPKTCKKCGATIGEALPHEFSVEVSSRVEPTCESDGKEAVYECRMCKKARTGGETIPKLEGSACQTTPPEQPPEQEDPETGGDDTGSGDGGSEPGEGGE